MHDLFSIYLYIHIFYFLTTFPWETKANCSVFAISLFILYYIILYSFAIIFLRNISYMNSPCQSYFTPIHLYNLILRHFKHQRFSFIYFLTIFRFCALSGCFAMENIYSVVLLMSTILHEYSYEIPKSEWKDVEGWGLRRRDNIPCLGVWGSIFMQKNNHNISHLDTNIQYSTFTTHGKFNIYIYMKNPFASFTTKSSSLYP